MRSVSPIPIVSLVGRSNSGKTTFIEKLITILQDQGLRVACVKQHHRDVEVDVVGKDSWRYARAGAACSIIATPVQISFVHQVSEAPSLVELASMAADAGCDVVLPRVSALPIRWTVMLPHGSNVARIPCCELKKQQD